LFPAGFFTVKPLHVAASNSFYRLTIKIILNDCFSIGVARVKYSEFARQMFAAIVATLILKSASKSRSSGE